MIPLLFSLLAAAAWAAPPELILVHGKVFLGPRRYAQAVAISGNRIAAVGGDDEILALKDAKTRVVDLAGRAITPGFHDAHAHFFKGAMTLTEADLSGASSLQEVRKRVSDYAAKNPGDGWLFGRNWDETALLESGYPTRLDLDTAVSTRPVALTDVTGRKLWLNTEGLKRAGITPYTPKLVTGKILKDDKGQPTGILIDDATGLASRAFPSISHARKLEALRRALTLARESGVTSIDSLAGASEGSLDEEVDLWRELYKNGEITVRHFIYGKLEDVSGLERLRKKAKDIPRDRLDFPGVSGFVDGTLADRTAALLEPYLDDEKNRGELKHEGFVLNSMVRKAHQLGYQVALSAVGDRAVRAALDACQKSQDKAKEDELILPAYPCRIEHVELIDRADLPRFKELGAAASMQPAEMTFDNALQNYNPNRLGPRVRYSFAWKTLENAAALLCFGSDWPRTTLAPSLALYAATTRKMLDGQPDGGWVPQERISLESAVQHFTADPARVLGRDDLLGTIAPGKLADLVVFDRDLFSTVGLELLQIEADITIFDGKIVFERPTAPKAP
jgi:predicted amidohydrolase YtcJ